MPAWGDMAVFSFLPSFLVFSEGSNTHFLLYWYFEPFHLKPIFVSKQQQVLKRSHYSVSQHTDLAPGIPTCWENKQELLSQPPAPPRRKLLLQRCWEHAKEKTGQGYQALVTRKEEKKVSPHPAGEGCHVALPGIPTLEVRSQLV